MPKPDGKRRVKADWTPCKRSRPCPAKNPLPRGRDLSTSSASDSSDSNRSRPQSRSCVRRNSAEQTNDATLLATAKPKSQARAHKPSTRSPSPRPKGATSKAKAKPPSSAMNIKKTDEDHKARFALLQPIQRRDSTLSRAPPSRSGSGSSRSSSYSSSRSPATDVSGNKQKADDDANQGSHSANHNLAVPSSAPAFWSPQSGWIAPGNYGYHYPARTSGQYAAQDLGYGQLLRRSHGQSRESNKLGAHHNRTATDNKQSAPSSSTQPIKVCKDNKLKKKKQPQEHAHHRAKQEQQGMPEALAKAKPHKNPKTKNGKADQVVNKDEEVAEQLETLGDYVEHFWSFSRLPNRHRKTKKLQQSCRNVQKAFATADPHTRGLMLLQLQGRMSDAIRCRNANRVVEFIIETLPATSTSLTSLIAEIHSVIARDPLILRHEYGCRLPQRLLEKCKPGQISAIVDVCILEGVSLIVDEYGNHVISSIFKHGTNDNIAAVMQTLTENVEDVARSEYGPSVFSAALASKSEDGTRMYRQGVHVEALANALVSQPKLLIAMVSDKMTGHGNIAAKDAINCTSEKSKEIVVLQLMEYTTSLRAPKYEGQPKDELRYGKAFANFIDKEARGYGYCVNRSGVDNFEGHLMSEDFSEEDEENLEDLQAQAGEADWAPMQEMEEDEPCCHVQQASQCSVGGAPTRSF